MTTRRDSDGVRRHGPLHLALLSLIGCGYCELGGGQSSTSVKSPGTDGVRVLARAEAAGTSARLELTRTTRKVMGRGEVRYLVTKSHTEQWLRLIVGDGGRGATFTLAEHDAAGAFARHEVAVAPDGRRVAVRLDDAPWRIAYVLTSTLAVLRREPHPGVLDWADIPDLEDAFVDLYRAQLLQHNELYSFHKLEPMVRWVASERGDEAAADVLFDVATLRDHRWLAQVNALSPQGRERMKSRLREAIGSDRAEPIHFTRAWELAAFDLDENAAWVAAGVDALVGDATTLANRGDDLAAYLEAHAHDDRAGAARHACALRAASEVANVPYALGAGRAARVTAERLCPP